MKCPYCYHEETKVIDKRETEEALATRRRRECLNCQKRFTTYERIETDLIVIKKDGRREKFNREKIKSGILKAIEKRPISIGQVDQIIDNIEATLKTKNSSEISSTLIGELVMKKLKVLDKVAYIRFASVYREFEDPSSFLEEIKILTKKKR
ncbi:transcriptional repressor NrdR [Candidatus Woesearchaeota archaeon]|nr:transcriptional repressor NrdR [Candidatus Woesearchaeota archaeon]